MATLIDSLHEEEQRLLHELSANPAYQRLNAIRSLLLLYTDMPQLEETVPRLDNGYSSVNPVNRSSNEVIGRTFRAKVSRDLRSSVSAQVIQSVAQHLRQTGQRADSTQLLDVVTKQNIPVGGGKPSATLASYLSASDLFDNVRGSGYGLREWSTDPTMTSLPLDHVHQENEPQVTSGSDTTVLHPTEFKQTESGSGDD